MFEVYHVRINSRDYVASDDTAANAVCAAMTMDEGAGGDHGASVSIHCSRRVGVRSERTVRRAGPETDESYRVRLMHVIRNLKLNHDAVQLLTGAELDAVGRVVGTKREQLA